MATIYGQREAVPRRLAAHRLITLEQALYVAIGVFAVILHLYMLGSRAFHHDETLHAQFSWRLYTNGDYTHDPLLHGPFLYYITAGMFLLFGDSDTTARLGAALFGIALTLSPLLLRRDIGRGAALLAATYLLISPVALYVGRFIRHDIFAVVFEVLAVVGLLRYIQTERPAWHYLLAAAAALMLTTMETFYLFLAIIGSFVVVWLLWQISRRALGWLAAYLVVVGAALKLLPRLPGIGPLPLPTEQQALNVRNQPDNNWGDYFQKVGQVVGPLARHPTIVVTLLATVALLGGLYIELWRRRDTSGQSAWKRATAAAEPGTLLYAVQRIRGRQWMMAFAIAFAIYAVLYTGFLSNIVHPNVTGLVTGVSGSFLYWLGQQGVRRGGQPAHFYLFELGLYEPLLLLGGTAGVGLVLRQLIRGRRAAKAGVGLQPAAEDVSPQVRAWSLSARAHQAVFAPALLAWWSIGALLIYSWAGEKMPWLTLHLVVPLALLSSWALARLGSWALRAGFDRRLLIVIGACLVLCGLCLLRLTTASMNNDARQIALAWVWPVGLLIVLGFGSAFAWVLNEARAALTVALALALLLLLPYTIRSSLRLSFETGDVAVEPMVFVQTSPDVARVMHQLQQAKLLYGSVQPLGVRYDNETVWQWYLRNEKNTSGSGGTTIGPVPDNVQVVFMLAENEALNKQYLGDFVSQHYPLRWWLPECDVYRFPKIDVGGNCSHDGSSLLSRLIAHPFNGQAILDGWQFALYRKMPNALSSTDMILYVRPAVADLFGLGLGQQ
ncbi:MAG: TIGR03663 family protein [Herpetosiphonaceae bacterium]|nr:TIGR03663 family protein [Herpetosiphonaceae bacterium]